MLITAVEPRRKGLSQLYIDGEAAMKLDTETLAKRRIRAGMELTDEELYDLVQESEARRASEKALYLLERRSHSKKELADKIARVTTKEAAQAAAQHMEDIGLVNDEDFAAMYARELFNRKKFGAARVRRELSAKGIDRDVIDAVTAEYEGDPCEKIAEILDRKYPLFREDEKIRRRAFAALQRMGYRYDQIREAASSMDDDYGCEDDSMWE